MKKLFTTCRVIETEKEFRENPKVIELLDDPRIFKNKNGEFSSISFFDKNKMAYLKSKKFRIITKNY